jgi:hydantoinase/carbamoylase family amidase
MLEQQAVADVARSAERIRHDVETLAGSEYTLSGDAICRYAYTDVYRNTLAYFRGALEELGFAVSEDPVGNFVARNRPAGTPVFGLGSHCDSNRNGGKWDGTLGVVTALEVARLSRDHGLELPLQLISWLEEEGSGFGQMLLGSRICTQRVSDADLTERFRALDDGRPFAEHAREAGYAPERWRESIRILDELTGWIELHIEQGRVLQDTGDRLGIVNAIAGYVHGDLVFTGRADHAGATPMDFRLDAAAGAAECVLELERLALAAGGGTVATAGEAEVAPGLINVVPGRARVSIDVRGVDEERFRGVVRDIVAFAERTAARRGLGFEFVERQALAPTPMDERVVAVLDTAAQAAGVPYRLMPSGAAHDTMCVAAHVPSAMVFVPCKDGISHSPLEDADPADAAIAAYAIVNAVAALQ